MKQRLRSEIHNIGTVFLLVLEGFVDSFPGSLDFALPPLKTEVLNYPQSLLEVPGHILNKMRSLHSGSFVIQYAVITARFVLLK